MYFRIVFQLIVMIVFFGIGYNYKALLDTKQKAQEAEQEIAIINKKLQDNQAIDTAFNREVIAIEGKIDTQGIKNEKNVVCNIPDKWLLALGNASR